MIILTLSGMVIQRWSGHIAQTFGFIAVELEPPLI